MILSTTPPPPAPSYASVEEREGSYAKLVNAYYELATLFYEWGWGSSFHFASRWRDESFSDSIKVIRRPEVSLGLTNEALVVGGVSRLLAGPS